MAFAPDSTTGGAESWRTSRILLVQGSASGVARVESLLCEGGFTNLVSTTDSRLALTSFLEMKPELVVLDLDLSPIDCFAVMDQLKCALPENEFVPIMILTESATEEMRQRVLAGGAADILVGPFVRQEAVLRIGNLLKIGQTSVASAREREALARELSKRTTEQEKTLAELRATQQHFLQSERLGALGSMISGIAHDFNNSLALILGSGELLQKACRKHNIAGEIANYAKTIVTAAIDSAETVQRLREFHQPSAAGEMRETLSLSEQVRQAVEITRPRWEAEAHARGLPVELRLDLAEPAVLVANGVELREMFTKLILNALDAMPQGGVLTLRTRALVGSVLLDVEDTGTGMTEEVRRRCLESFFTTKGEHAAGLGLTVVRGIVRRHGGTVSIRSERGQGTLFSFVFPAGNSLAGESEVRVPPARREMSVLVVDDQPVLRDLLGEMLSAEGHRVELACHGRSALEKFETRQFDLVITDKAMPEMNGDQLAAAIKARSPETPVIMLTGFGDGDGCREHLSEFVDRLLMKPASIADLREAIDSVTRRFATAG
jgi:signal transduction histidine kinase/ActR/RegA family two-component response regulator